MKKRIPLQFRQGDVLIVMVDSLPKNVVAKTRDNGRVVLAYGEVTGHAHAIIEKKVIHYDAPDAVSAAEALLASVGMKRQLTAENAPTFLELATEAPLQHEEHGTIKLPAGRAVVIRQREYSPTELRSVAD
jgi:hypothetical protein